MSEHPITPPAELILKWMSSLYGFTEAARWGYEQGIKEGGRRMQKMLNEVANYVD